MGRTKAKKPREYGSGGLLAQSIVWVDQFPTPEQIRAGSYDQKHLAARVMAISLDPATMALQRLRKRAGRKAFYEAAHKKGLDPSRVQKLEGVLSLLDQITLHLALSEGENDAPVDDARMDGAVPAPDPGR